MTRHHREGVAQCAKCSGPHTRVTFHEDGTQVTADDCPYLVRDILSAYAAISGHASSLGMQAVLCPKPPPRPGRDKWTLDCRTTASREWLERKLTITSIELDLVDRGLMRVVNEPCGPNGQYHWGYAITDSGRSVLAAMTGTS